MRPQTATEVMMIENAKYHSLMQYQMAKALVEGKVGWRTLKYAEEIYETQKEIFENS